MGSKHLITILFVCILSTLNVCDATANASPLSSQAIENSELRKGFQFVYTIANEFIDLIKINYPTEVFGSFSNDTASVTFSQFEKSLVDYFASGDWQAIFKKIYNTAPGLIIFIAFEILFILLFPIIGLIVCCCRTCCCKSELVDAKNDKLKRKILSVIMFVALVALLLILVVIFVTNSYAKSALRSTGDVVHKNTKSLKNFIDSDLKNFTENVKTSAKSFKNSIPEAINKTEDVMLESVVAEIDNSVDPVFNSISDEYLSPLTKTNELNGLLDSIVFEQWRTNIDEIVNITSNTNIDNPTEFEKIDIPGINIQDLLNQFGDKNSVLNYSVLLDSIRTNIDKYKNDLNTTFEDAFVDVSNGIDDIYNLVDNYTDVFDKTDIEVVNYGKYLSYYDYGYYSFLGISVFVLLVFLLFMLGCLGICCSRKQEYNSQTCHRGISARCISCGSAFVFIFGSLLMLVCLVMFFIGFSTRNFACKPLIELDNNKLIQYAKRISEINKQIANVSFSNIITQCRNTDSIEKVTEINNILKKNFNITINDIRNEEFYMNILDPGFDAFLSSVNSTNINFQTMNFNHLPNLNLNKVFFDFYKQSFEANLTAHRAQFTKVEQFLSSANANATNIAAPVGLIRQILGDYNSTLNRLSDLIVEWYQAGLNNTDVTTQVNNQIDALNIKINNKTYLNSAVKNIITDSVNNVLKSSIQENINTYLIKGIPLIPSCKLVATLYDDITINICYEVFDNFNAYWFALWLTLLIYAIFMIFALKYATLLNKMHPYGESFDDIRASPVQKIEYYDANSVPLRQMPPTGRRIHPIDAYTNKAGYSSDSPPPTYNYKSQRL